MQKIFIYDAVTGEFVLNEPELKLLREFNDLWLVAKQRCGCLDVNDNGIGHGNSEAIMKYANYCKFVYLYADYASPYRDYPENDKRIQAAYDCYLTNEESVMEQLSVACDKWVEMQSMDRNVRILRAGQKQVDDLISYFSEEGKLTKMKDGKPVYKAKDIMSELREIGSISDELDRHEERVRLGDTSQSNIRGGAVEGLIIDFAKEKERRMKLKEQSEGNVKLDSEPVPEVNEVAVEEPEPIDTKPEKNAKKKSRDVVVRDSEPLKKRNVKQSKSGRFVSTKSNKDWMENIGGM